MGAPTSLTATCRTCSPRVVSSGPAAATSISSAERRPLKAPRFPAIGSSSGSPLASSFRSQASISATARAIVSWTTPARRTEMVGSRSSGTIRPVAARGASDGASSGATPAADATASPGEIPPSGRRDIGGNLRCRWRLKDAEQFLCPLRQLRLRHPRLLKERGEPLVARGLGVQGISIARVCPLQGVVEHAHQIVVLVAGSDSTSSTGVHLFLLSIELTRPFGIPVPGTAKTVHHPARRASGYEIACR